MNGKWIFVFALGFASVYVLKYGVFGLDAWNAVLHPRRIEGPIAQRFFGKPLLGLLG